jgi:hypothetical protein
MEYGKILTGTWIELMRRTEVDIQKLFIESKKIAHTGPIDHRLQRTPVQIKKGKP